MLHFESSKKPKPSAELRSEKIFSDEFAFIDDCLALAARQVEILGTFPQSQSRIGNARRSLGRIEFLYERDR